MILPALCFFGALLAALIASWRADKRAAAEAERLRREALPAFPEDT